MNQWILSIFWDKTIWESTKWPDPLRLHGRCVLCQGKEGNWNGLIILRRKSSQQECSAHLQPEPAIRSLWRVAWASTFDSLAGTNSLSPHLGTNVCRFLTLSWLVCSCVGCPGVQHHGSPAMTVHLRKRKSISISSQYNSCSCFPMLFLSSSKFTRFFTVVDASKLVIMW